MSSIWLGCKGMNESFTEWDAHPRRKDFLKHDDMMSISGLWMVNIYQDTTCSYKICWSRRLYRNTCIYMCIHISNYSRTCKRTHICIYIHTRIHTASIYTSIQYSTCHIFVCLPYLRLPVYLCICLCVYLFIHLFVCLLVYLSICRMTYLSICLSDYLSTCLSVYLSTCLSSSLYLSNCLFTYIRIYLSI